MRVSCQHTQNSGWIYQEHSWHQRRTGTINQAGNLTSVCASLFIIPLKDHLFSAAFACCQLIFLSLPLKAQNMFSAKTLENSSKQLTPTLRIESITQRGKIFTNQMHSRASSPFFQPLLSWKESCFCLLLRGRKWQSIFFVQFPLNRQDRNLSQKNQECSASQWNSQTFVFGCFKKSSIADVIRIGPTRRG